LWGRMNELGSSEKKSASGLETVHAKKRKKSIGGGEETTSCCLSWGERGGEKTEERRDRLYSNGQRVVRGEKKEHILNLKDSLTKEKGKKDVVEEQAGRKSKKGVRAGSQSSVRRDAHNKHVVLRKIEISRREGTRRRGKKWTRKNKKEKKRYLAVCQRKKARWSRNYRVDYEEK